MLQMPSVVILKLIDIGNFLRGADRYAKEDPMIFIQKVIDLIESGAVLRDDLANIGPDYNPTDGCDAYDKALREVEK
jgi:hypothetical protein